MTDASSVPASNLPADRLTVPTACIRCSYNLVGLSPQGVCPECGTSVEDSTRGFFLRYSAPEYIQQLRKGLALVLNAILLMIVLAVASIFVMSVLPPSGVNHIVVEWAGLIPAAMSVLGYWMYTQPDPKFVGGEQPLAARSTLRAAVVVNGVLTLFGAVLSLFSFVGADTVSGALRLLGMVVWLVQFFSMMKYTAWVATRLPDAVIQKKSLRYRWLLPVIFLLGMPLFFLGPLIALVMYWNLLHRVRNIIKEIETTNQSTALIR